VAYYLADMLRKSGIKTRIIEDDAARCAELCELLPDADISCGDCGDMEVLEQEGLTDYDAIVTMTGHDELNMIASLYAGSQKVPQVITKIADKGSNTIINSLGLGSVICPKELCCNDIIRYVRAMQNQTGAALSVHAIADGQVEALEFLVDANTENCGIPLKQLKTKPNVLIASIGHGSKTEIPNGDSVFQQGDSMVVIASGRGSIRQINDIFA
jgi:trk system potassium uptake protein TrkA